MKPLYRVTDGTETWFVQADSICKAVAAWIEDQRKEFGAGFNVDPEGVELIGWGEVILPAPPESNRPKSTVDEDGGPVDPGNERGRLHGLRAAVGLLGVDEGIDILDALVRLVFRGELVHFPTAIKQLPEKVADLIDAAKTLPSEQLTKQGYDPAAAAAQLPEALSVLGVLAAIAVAYDANEMEPRKNWVQEGVPYFDPRRADQIELCTTRGGRCLLTVADCQAARAVIMAATKAKAVQP